MPYLTEFDRSRADDGLHECGLDLVPDSAGEVNFIVSTLIANYLKVHGCRYAVLNEMIGALECAKLELYRKIGGPYEDVKESENGPVYNNILPTQEY